jgi:hypothetical protein
MSMRLPWAIAFSSIGGCAAFCALLPWGDPCAVAGYSGHACPIVLSTSQEYWRNAVFVVICLLIGFAAGSITHSRRYLAGTLSVPLSAIFASVIGRFLYAVDAPPFRAHVADAYVTAAVYFAFLAGLGAVGAAASRWSPIKRWRGL